MSIKVTIDTMRFIGMVFLKDVTVPAKKNHKFNRYYHNEVNSKDYVSSRLFGKNQNINHLKTLKRIQSVLCRT